MKIKILDVNAIVPLYAHDTDAGLDLYSIDRDHVLPGGTAIVSTGLAIELEPGYEAQIRPRSGMAAKSMVTVLNSPGTIDAGYRGELKVILINHGKEDFAIVPGMKIAQMVIAPVEQVKIEVVTELSDSDRGEGGFGSTGS